MAAIGGFAFSKADGGERLELLLILPIILSGLGLAYLGRSHNGHLIGEYVRENLWPVLLQSESSTTNTSWARFIKEKRRLKNFWVAPSGLLSFVPDFFIFGIPSVAALIINWPDDLDGGLKTAWFVDLGALVVSMSLVVWVGIARSSRE